MYLFTELPKAWIYIFHIFHEHFFYFVLLRFIGYRRDREGHWSCSPRGAIEPIGGCCFPYWSSHAWGGSSNYEEAQPVMLGISLWRFLFWKPVSIGTLRHTLSQTISWFARHAVVLIGRINGNIKRTHIHNTHITEHTHTYYFYWCSTKEDTGARGAAHPIPIPSPTTPSSPTRPITKQKCLTAKPINGY